MPPAVFLAKDGAPTSFHLIPLSWTEDDIDAYYTHPWLPSGDQMGLLEVTDEDFDAAGVRRPVPAPVPGEPFGDIHYEPQGGDQRVGGRMPGGASGEAPSAGLLETLPPTSQLNGLTS